MTFIPLLTLVVSGVKGKILLCSFVYILFLKVYDKLRYFVFTVTRPFFSSRPPFMFGSGQFFLFFQSTPSTFFVRQSHRPCSSLVPRSCVSRNIEVIGVEDEVDPVLTCVDTRSMLVIIVKENESFLKIKVTI